MAMIVLTFIILYGSVVKHLDTKKIRPSPVKCFNRHAKPQTGGFYLANEPKQADITANVATCLSQYLFTAY
jgi:hypothetical protein